MENAEEEEGFERFLDVVHIIRETGEDLDKAIIEKRRIEGYPKYKLDAMVKAEESLYQAQRDLLQLIATV